MRVECSIMCFRGTYLWLCLWYYSLCSSDKCLPNALYRTYLKYEFSLSVKSLKANLSRSLSSRPKASRLLFSRRRRQYRAEAQTIVMQ